MNSHVLNTINKYLHVVRFIKFINLLQFYFLFFDYDAKIIIEEIYN